VAALLLLTGPQAGRRHEVTGEVIIGRSPSCTISLEDAKVSRRHVRLALEGGEARVSDLGSRNGTLLDRERLEPGQPKRVARGAALVFGAIFPTLVGWYLIPLIKGGAFGPRGVWYNGFLINGAWGLGTGVFAGVLSRAWR
jgi:pSer/pThr/pTyr-binding forkhead associated (FHA) protein